MDSINDKLVERVLVGARRKLLDLGTRNRLVHVNRENTRSNSLNIINERSEDVLAILRGGSRNMRFKAMGTDRGANQTDKLLLAAPDDTIVEGSDRYKDQILETPLGPEGLARRLLRLSIAARTAEEEQGLNILYLAMGFLRWNESGSSEIVREAPLLLLPVELVRNQKTSSYDIKLRDDELSTNLPLSARLLQDEGIALPDVEDDKILSPEAYFNSVSEAISSKPSWSIDRNGMQLGFFSFAKLLMHRDLNPDAWDDGAFEENDLLNGLLSEGFDEADPLFGPQDRLDDHLEPAQIIQVVDADASQTKVIEEVRKGASMVVQGPPGTGKSQTIANIIAGAVHDGKTVLFVAEKMAALSVVHDRLVKVGLRDVCLELHSRTANKKALAKELRRSLAASTTTFDSSNETHRLKQSRDELNDIVELLHAPTGKSGDTPFSTMAELVGLKGQKVPPPRIDSVGLDALTLEARAECISAIEHFIEASVAVPEPDRHPFRAVNQLDLQPTDLERLQLDISDAIDAIEIWRDAAEQCSIVLQKPAAVSIVEGAAAARAIQLLQSAPVGIAETLEALFPLAKDNRMTEGLERGAQWRAAYDVEKARFSQSAFTMPTGEIRRGLMRGQSSFWGRLFEPYRSASNDLSGLLSRTIPKLASQRLDLIDSLEAVQEMRRVFSEDEQWLERVLGDIWRGESTDFAALLEKHNWLGEVLAACRFSSVQDVHEALKAVENRPELTHKLTQAETRVSPKIMAVIDRLGLSLRAVGFQSEFVDCALPEVCDRLTAMQRNPSGYADWATYERASHEASAKGGAAVIGAVRKRDLLVENAVSEFRYACAEARWADIRASKPELNGLSSKDRHALVASFQDRDRARLAQGREEVLSRHYQQTPRGSTGEMGLIRGEMGKKRGHKSVRWLMKNAGAMVQRIKPVMLMSPLSVAQFLPPSRVSFDLLVIDEASQVRPEDALGVIARARQIVVVGDTQQLPPTNFFGRLVEDTDEEDEDSPVVAAASDMESVLSLCEARGLRARMLEWHYRSKDPSLIRVSNAEFYEDRLVLPPSPLEKDENYGLKFRRVPGVYAAANSGLGRAGTNRIEAEAIVKAVADHARQWSKLSLGIVAFSKSQADMITEVLEFARRSDQILDALLREGKGEDVFIKNIENVQGDERDVIFISIGYGPSEPNGLLTKMKFGPINSEGGERRLNVLFSRSRVRCEIFASFEPGNIDLGRTQNAGSRVLKRFLEYAKSGIMEERAPTGEGADSPFEEDVAREICNLGYLVDYQVGSVGFRIDLGIRHPDRPGQYFLAVECDGATYHSALWARERDRLRQEVLEHLGWTFHRIWSTDWFHRKDQEIKRLEDVLVKAKALIGDGIVVEGANELALQFAPDETNDEPEQLNIEAVQITVPPYERSQRRVSACIEPHLASLSKLAELVRLIIEDEGPIHLDEVARRVAVAFGKTKAGKRINESTQTAFRHAKAKSGTLFRDGDFVMTLFQQSEPPIRDRSLETDGVIKAEYLPPIEILAAADLIERESGLMGHDELLKSITRVLGFKRTGPKVNEVIGEILVSADRTTTR